MKCAAQVFSQWKDALLVVSKALSSHKIGHVALTGGRQGKVSTIAACSRHTVTPQLCALEELGKTPPCA